MLLKVFCEGVKTAHAETGKYTTADQHGCFDKKTEIDHGATPNSVNGVSLKGRETEKGGRRSFHTAEGLKKFLQRRGHEEQEAGVGTELVPQEKGFYFIWVETSPLASIGQSCIM